MQQILKMIYFIGNTRNTAKYRGSLACQTHFEK